MLVKVVMDVTEYRIKAIYKVNVCIAYSVTANARTKRRRLSLSVDRKYYDWNGKFKDFDKMKILQVCRFPDYL